MRFHNKPYNRNNNQLQEESRKNPKKATGIWKYFAILGVFIALVFRFIPLILLFLFINAVATYTGIFGNGTIGGVGAGNSSYGGTEITSIDSTPLIRAAVSGNYDKVKKILAEEEIPVNGSDSEQRTALIGAAYNERNEICKLLIAAGANPYMQDINGFNALDFAAARGLVDTVKLLLQESKSPDRKNHIEYAMIMQAAFSGNIDLLPEGKDSLRSINRISPENKTPLHISAGNGAVDIASLLIKRGAKANITISGGQTPLHWAAWNNKTETTRLLIEKSAKINATDNDGTTPLMLAAKNNSKESVILLLEKGADKNLRDKNDDNATKIAINNGFIEIADILQKQ